MDAVFDEVAQSGFGFRHRHAVQVDLRLNGKAPAGQLAQGPSADVRPVEAQTVMVIALHRVDIGVEAFCKHARFIVAGEPCDRPRSTRRRGRALLSLEWPGIAHEAAKELYVVVGHRGFGRRIRICHATFNAGHSV